jgi:hypothetical protein
LMSTRVMSDPDRRDAPRLMGRGAIVRDRYFTEMCE